MQDLIIEALYLIKKCFNFEVQSFCLNKDMVIKNIDNLFQLLVKSFKT